MYDDKKLKFLLKQAKLQGFVGVSQIKEIAESAEEETFLSAKLRENGVDINNFLRQATRSYKTVAYVAKNDNRFLLTTRTDENGISFLLDINSEKELFERMTTARNKMLKFAFASVEIHDFIKKLADKVKDKHLRITTLLNYKKDDSDEVLESKKVKFLRTMDKLDEGSLHSIDFNEKTKALIYNTYTKTADYKEEIKKELYDTEQIYSSIKREIIEANIRLVFCIAKEYSVVHKGILDISDIIQEGNIGLIQAVESFDYKKGVKFSSWAIWYIRREIWVAINSFRKTVHIPTKAITDLHKISVFKEKYKVLNGKNPEIEEIAKELELTAKQVSSILAADFGETNSNYDFAIPNSDFDNDADEFNNDLNNPFNKMVTNGLKDEINYLLSRLKPMHSDMIKMHFGLDENDEPLNFAQIGKIYGLSRERVRQIIFKSMEKIKLICQNTIKELK